MNTDDILDALEHVNEDCVKKAKEPQKRRSRKALWISVGTMAACLALVLVLPTVLRRITLSDQEGIDLPDIRNYKPFGFSTKEEAINWPWDCQTIAEQFPAVIYNDTAYYLRRSYLEEDMKVSSALIGEKLTDTTTSGYDWKNDINYTTDCSLYEIAGVDPDRFLAVTYAGDENKCDYYVFMQNEFNPPATLGDFITSLNLTETLPLTKFYYKTYDYTKRKGETKQYGLTPEDSKAVWEMIVSYSDKETQTDDIHGYKDKRIGFSATSQALGAYNLSFSLTADGYLSTNLEDYGYSFYLGEEAVEEIRNYILSHKTEAPNEFVQNLYGVVTEIGEDYIKVDDSIVMENPEDGTEYTVYADDMRVKRYIISGYLKVGNHVRIRYGGLFSFEPNIISNAFLLEKGGFEFEDGDYNFLIPE